MANSAGSQEADDSAAYRLRCAAALFMRDVVAPETLLFPGISNATAVTCSGRL